MRILMISKALIVGQYQAKAEALARKPGVELTVVVPPSWRDERGLMRLEKEHLEGYNFVVAPIRFNGHFHMHYYPGIGKILDNARPELLHLDEEPYNLSTFLALLEARRRMPTARALFFTWQNLPHRHPPPFSWMQAFVFANTDIALAGSQPAERVLRSKGFTKPVRVVPQFGVDPLVFRPAAEMHEASKFVVGFAARLVPEKGASLLLGALRQLGNSWELRIVGSGPERTRLESLARRFGIGESVHFLPWQSSDQMPDFFRSLDVLVAPSLSRPNWTEQFGRVLIEAMACGIPVIGSSAGEIPNVIGDAGLVFPEGDASGLASALHTLMLDHARRRETGNRGRARVLEKFTQSQIADETYSVYCELAR